MVSLKGAEFRRGDIVAFYYNNKILVKRVIAAHNYKTHFGRLKELRPGDEVRFTDTEGNAFRYTVAELETLGKYDVEEMAAGDWDLTLFTCTYGGQSRVTVRCLRVTEEP